MYLRNSLNCLLSALAILSVLPSAKAKGKAEAFLLGARELVGVPFEVDPVRKAGRPHPTELKEVTNCSGVVSYGLRRAGIEMPYLSAKGLRLEMRRRGWLVSGKAIRTGDILQFGSQTAIVAEDLPPLGELSGNDLILHAYYAPVTAQPWSEVSYNKSLYEVYRIQ